MKMAAEKRPFFCLEFALTRQVTVAAVAESTAGARAHPKELGLQIGRLSKALPHVNTDDFPVVLSPARSRSF